MSALGTLPWLAYARRGSAPVPPAPDFLVTNDAEFAAANLAATTGQVIQLQDSGTFGNLTLTNATGITVQGQTPMVPRVKTLKVVGATNATVTGLRISPGETVADSTRLVNIVATNAVPNDGLKFIGNLVEYGNPWNGYTPFDVTVTDTARMGTNGSWSATAPYLKLPYGIGSQSTIGGETIMRGNNIEISGNIVQDTCEAIKFAFGGGNNLKINGNTLRRIYQDFISFGMTYYSLAVKGIEICGNLMQDAFSQPQDNGNPHSDILQIFGSDLSGVEYLHPIKGLLVAGNVASYTPGCRGEPQGVFLSDIMDGYPFIAPVIADNFLISRMTDKGATLANFDVSQTGGVWAYVYRNLMLSNPQHNAPTQNEQYANSVSGVTPNAGTGVRTIMAVTDPLYGSPPNLVKDNIAEAFTGNLNTISVGNINTGRGSGAAAYGSYANLNTSAAWDAANTPDALFAAFQTPATTGKGAGVAANTATGLRQAWVDPSTRPVLPNACTWYPVNGGAVSTLYTSGWAWPHIFTASRSVSISGGEYRTADDHTGANATAWTSSAGTVATGKFLQVRGTSSANPNTTTTVTVTLGGQAVTWTIATADDVEFPVVESDGAARFISAGSPGADSALATGAFKVKFPSSNPASSTDLFCAINSAGAFSSTYIRCLWLTTGLLRLAVYNNAGVLIAQCNMSGATLAGQTCDIQWSLDVSQATVGAGFSIWVNGVDRTANTGTWTGGEGVAIGWSRTSTSGNLGILGGSGSMMGAGTQIGMVYLNISERVNLSLPENRAKFQPSAIGHDGSGPTGNIPHTFWTGTKAQVEVGSGLNWGSGVKYIKAGTGTVTDISGDPW